MEDSQIIVSDIYKELLSLKERLVENGGTLIFTTYNPISPARNQERTRNRIISC